MKRRLNGEGTVFEENDPRRRTTHRAQMEVRLPDGSIKRIVARGYSRTDALQKARAKARRASEVMPEADRLKMRDYLDRWLEYKRQQVRESTIATYENDAKHLKRHLGDRTLGKLRAYDVQLMLTEMQQARPGNNKGMRSQADKARRTLKQALRQAVRWELIPRSPIEHLDPLTKPPVERGAWGPDEIRRFLDAVKAGQRDVYYPIFVTALFTGARAGELLALEWQDVEDDHIIIRRTWTRHSAKTQPPKTKAGHRIIPIGPFVRDALGERGEPRELVFRGQRGTRPRPENLRRALNHYAKKANVDPIRFHDLRRTYATTLARLGHHPRVIQKLLGHSTPTLAMTVYTDVLREQEHAARLDPESVMGGAGFGADASNRPSSEERPAEAVITGSKADGDAA